MNDIQIDNRGKFNMNDIKNIEIFQNFVTTLKETSKYEDDKKNIYYMTLSELEVINFDKSARKYIEDMSTSNGYVRSNDALYIVRNLFHRI
jgi:hypothetical protein